jgi:hypothetical protein
MLADRAVLYDLVDVISGEFAGLELPLEAARERRRASGRRTALVPVRYRRPRTTLKEARTRARTELRDRQRDYPGVTFEDVRVHGYHPMVYTFVTLSPEWQREGRVPGGLLCCVDKVDGHVWPVAEQLRYATTNAG